MKKIKIDRKLIKNLIPKRPVQSHKYTFGKLLIWSGSLNYWGAPQLVTKGAYRSGVGLVRLACPEQIIPTIASTVPEATFLPISIAQNGAFLPNTVITLLREIQEANIQAIVVGPGLGQSNFLCRLLTELLQKVSIPAVLDGDALSGLAQIANFKELLRRDPVKILTPHTGEFSRLINIDAEVIIKRRVELAHEFALENNCVLVLKGPKTIVTNGKKVFENTTGSTNLATAGTGDILAGLIGGLLAQGINPMEAANIGVYLHSSAGDLWLKNSADRGMFAQELCNYIPTVYQTLIK